MRKVFLEDLPKKEKGKTINWNESIGYKVRFIYNNIEGYVEIVDYKSKGRCLYIKYEDKDVFKIYVSRFQECGLGGLLGGRRTLNDRHNDRRISGFKIDLNETFKDDKRYLTIIDREYRIRINKDGYKQKLKYYKYKCNKCGYDEGWILECNLLKGINCACCSGQTTITGINDIATVAPWMIKYFQNPEEAKLRTCQSATKIYPICPYCGRVRNKEIRISNIYNSKSIGCSCGDGQSYPNKFMFSLLEQLKINFESEYCPKWSNLKKYDFYFMIKNKEYIVEMDGGWHKKDNSLSGKTKEESIAIDEYKDLKAKENGIEVIRIDCKKSNIEYIKGNILKSNIIDLFDLSNINWNKCEEFALSNRVKIACEYKKNNPNMTSSEIGRIMNLHCRTIAKYLKKGTELGWCEYDPVEEHRKSLIKIKRGISKKVEIFKDGVSLGIFESTMELERKSLELFGIKIQHSEVSKVCLNKNSNYKGYIFKYI